MNENKTLKIIDNEGKEFEYEILMAFKWSKTNKNYVIYTDNSDSDNLNIYAAIYYPNDDNRLDSITTEEEWNEIEKRLKWFKKGK